MSDLPSASDANPSRIQPTDTGSSRRLFRGWSANVAQILLGVTQQILLVPIFLKFWSSDTLAAWLAIFAAGNLIILADVGLQLRAINRFFAFGSSSDRDGRTGSFYAGLLGVYFPTIAGWSVLLVLGAILLPPSRVLGFSATDGFDVAMIGMMLGMLLSLPVSLVAGLYRVRGEYGRMVWLQNASLLLGQIAQILAIAIFGSLVAVATAYVASQLLLMGFLIFHDAPRLFVFLRRVPSRKSWRWRAGQFRLAFPFAIANITELTLLNLPVLLVSALVVDRVAVVQWGLTRVIAGLVRGFCIMMLLPVVAELGHSYAISDKERLRRFYAQGSVFVTALASLIVAGLLPFWSDFFTLWTHGSIPYDAPLVLTLLLGSVASAPSLLALVYASHSNRGHLLVRTKGLQLVVFLVLSFVLIPRLGPLGAAIAIVASDVLVQFGLLGAVIMRQTLQHPLRHTVFIAAVMSTFVLTGWALGTTISALVPGSGLQHFVAECVLWMIAVGLLASPLLSTKFRERLLGFVPA
ncbi:hypothetical protein [Bradyrhizobium betae]|uniref:Oligosaccharide flippase family protein n=1 Tax=Bradyrhizobium betae TaxID=244734 RepID=A0A5P6PBB5_9BRAD|nr:hypothetical protein [Bradyrhizobium betae]MCS3726376.1 O-antigen/teichoic acid export membrane protein [Bradyrhizobium betae]QFI75611.1 hypothetical protein F8237_26360 [Bradyrhizobium betae]